ncbi:hypothetical protein ABPG75_009149 [Micractinium tetrahymenae]
MLQQSDVPVLVDFYATWQAGPGPALWQGGTRHGLFSVAARLLSTSLPHCRRCGPCQMQSQVIDQLAPQMRGRVKFVKVDTEKYHKVASQYNIGALPTLVLFKNGQPVDRIEGLLMADQLKQRLEYFLASTSGR